MSSTVCSGCERRVKVWSLWVQRTGDGCVASHSLTDERAMMRRCLDDVAVVAQTIVAPDR